MKVKYMKLNPTGISQYVRTAEKLIATGNYRTALDALSVAQELHPHNSDLQGIVEQALRLEAEAAAGRGSQKISTIESDRRRSLSVTIGKRYERGIKEDGEAHFSPQEVRAQVQCLVDTAGVLLNRGFNESAFESLMQAYLLDPLSPELISSEQEILPVLAAMEKRPAQEAIAFHSLPESQPTEDLTDRSPDLPKKASLFKRWLRDW